MMRVMVGYTWTMNFSDVVANEAYEAQEKVVEEVLDAERRVERRMATSDMFGNRNLQKDA